jgi:hypothetical protein
MSLLNGFRVVQVGGGRAAAVCGRLLADIGAEVVCIEPDNSTTPFGQWRGIQDTCQAMRHASRSGTSWSLRFRCPSCPQPCKSCRGCFGLRQGHEGTFEYCHGACSVGYPHRTCGASNWASLEPWDLH